MNRNHMREILIGIGSAGHASFSKMVFVSFVSGPAQVLFFAQRWQHTYCCFFGVLLIAFNTVETWRASRGLKNHLGQPHPFEEEEADSVTC